MNVAEIMSSPCLQVRVGTTLDDAMARMDEADVRHLVVVEDSGPVGVLSDRDLLEATGWLAPRQRQVLESPDSTVRDVMRGPVLSVAPDDDLSIALGLLIGARISCLPVRSEDAVVGILTETDLLRTYVREVRAGRVPASREPSIADLMTVDPVTIAPDAAGDEAAALLLEHRVRHLPVTADGSLVGMLSDRDLRRARGRGQLETSTVDELMTSETRRATPDQSLSAIAALLIDEHISAVPVLFGDDLRGIATTIDLMAPCVRGLRRE